MSLLIVVYEKSENIHYLGKHTGLIYIKAICGTLNDTVNIEDLYLYKPTGSQTFTSSNAEYRKLFDLTGLNNFEVTAEIGATANKGFALRIKENDDTNPTYYVNPQVDGAGYYGTYLVKASNSDMEYLLYDTMYSANTFFNISITYINGVFTVTHNGKTFTSTKIVDPNYLYIVSWTSAKTVNYKNLKIKAL